MEPKTNESRQDFINWPEYFMAISFLAAKRSKDPITQVGACVVNQENRVVGVGYNGMPKGIDYLPWGKDTENPLKNKHLFVCHAETNAILNKNSHDVKGCSLYVCLFPCNECAKVIIQSGITEVIYFSDKHKDKTHTKASKMMFNAAGITYKQFIPRQSQIVIDFEEINKVFDEDSLTKEFQKVNV